MILAHTDWPAEESQAVFQATVNSPDEEFTLWIEGDGEDDLKRWMGCVLVATMPPHGLDETLRMLSDVYEFAIEDSALSLPSPRQHASLAGRVGKGSKRPELRVSE